MTYRMECDPVALTCRVFKCVDNNRFALNPSRLVPREGPKPTGLSNLREVIQRSHENKWRCCELYTWLVEHMPDHEYRGLSGSLNDLAGKSDVLIQFKSTDQMVLFKLTWAGV